MPKTFLRLRTPLIAAAALLFTLASAHAQCKPPANQHPVLSPAAQTSVSLEGQALTVYYCAPSMRGRKIMGGLVPYGKVWRTGANTSTTFKTEANLKIGNVSVPAGTYTFYTLPSAKTWLLIVNKQVGQWGLTYHQADDLARIPMKRAAAPSEPVQTFKIAFEHTHGDRTQLHLIWAHTDVYVPIRAVK